MPFLVASLLPALFSLLFAICFLPISRNAEADVAVPDRRAAAVPVRGTQALSAEVPATAAHHAESPEDAPIGFV